MSETIKQTVYTFAGEKKGEIDLPLKVFGQELKQRVVSEAVVALQKAKRSPIAHTKDRASVRGGGRKPWRQKGTGRARHGSIRSPIWRGGGVTHGPTRDRRYTQNLNAKFKTKTLTMALSQKLRAGEVLIVDLSQPMPAKTKIFKEKLDILMKGRPEGSILLVVTKASEELKRSTRNLARLALVEARNVGLLDALKAKYIVLAEDSVAVLDKRLT